ncbi:putative membrane protein [Photobacterium marinum]|uniref:Putative membrane protein n=1 Tax=Photobacterium marinum TaxID=1056511 RepID=L8JH77_9GAMM|nr:putative membrane protein [Photobacterium marinum]
MLFIIFALLGGLLVMWRRLLVFVHLPAAVWVALISFKGWICPLTPLEIRFRRAAGEQGYSGGFVEHYIIPVIYPEQLNFNVQIVLGFVAVLINLCIYGCVFYRFYVENQVR